MFSARFLITATRGTASRMIGRPFRASLSSFLRCALSTTGDTSGSHLTKKVGDSPINILPDISSTIKASDTANFVTSTYVKISDIQSDKSKPMDRDVEIRSLKDTIKSKDVALMRLSEEISSVSN